jgi:hypothetical protein
MAQVKAAESGFLSVENRDIAKILTFRFSGVETR